MILCQSVAQQLVGNMRIDFRRAHAGVAEHLLYGKQIRTTFKQMCCKTMPESVWADGLSDAVFLGQVLDNQENHLTCKACATAVEENGVGEFGLRRDV